MPPGAGGQAGQADGPDLDARQPLDGVADGGQHPAHLAVAALEDGELDFGVGLRRRGRRIGGNHVAPRSCGPAVAFLGARRTRGRPRPTNTLRRLGADNAAHDDVLRRRGEAVFQVHAARQFVQGGGVGDAAHVSAVRLGDVVLGVGQLVQKVAVIGQEDQTLRVRVQPPDRAQHGAAGQFNQFRDQPGRVNVAAGADDVARLVHGDVIAPLGGPHPAAITDDDIARGVHLDAELGHDLAIDPDASLLNPLFAGPPRGDPGVRQDLLEPFACGRVGGVRGRGPVIF